MTQRRIILASDGGAKRANGAAASACLVEDRTTKRSLKLLAILGTATNNEAEIFAALLGFALLRALFSDEKRKELETTWLCDSEYVLLSATKYIEAWQRNGWKTADKRPVKNQGLWRAYLALSAESHFSTQHVYGHTGDRLNEACDTACSWAIERSEQMLDDIAEGEEVLIDDGVGERGWLLVDGRLLLKRFREESPTPGDIRQFVAQVSAVTKKRVRHVSRHAKAVEEDHEEQILSGLAALVASGELVTEPSKELRQLLGALRDLLRRYEQLLPSRKTR